MSIKLVFADDSVTMQKVIQLTLDNEDVDLRIVSNGEEALTALKEEKPDVVVADVSIPGINGFELCKRIKSSPETDTIPVILISGEMEEYDGSLGESAGADAHITKPFKSGEFVETVKKLAVKDSSQADKTEPAENSVPLPETVEEEESLGETPSSAEEPEIPVMLELSPEKSMEDDAAEEIDGEMDGEFEIVEDDLDLEEDDLDDDEESEKNVMPDDVEIGGVDLEEEKELEDLPEIVTEPEENADEAEKILETSGEKPPEAEAERDASKGMDGLFRDSLEQAVHNFLKNEAGGILKEVLAESVDRHINNVFKTQLETVIREEISKAIGESFQSSMPELLGMIEKITSHITPRIAEEMIKIAIEQIKKGDI